VTLEGTSRIITRTSFWPGIDNSRDNRLSLFNASGGSSRVTLTALDSAGQLLRGTNISNSVLLSLSANQSVDQTLREIFGTGATNIATVRVQSVSANLVATGTTSGQGLTESLPLLDHAIANFVLPSVGEDGRLHVVNSANLPVSDTLTLRSNRGAVLAAKTIDLAPLPRRHRHSTNCLARKLKDKLLPHSVDP
jgi:hypothetical protein